MPLNLFKSRNFAVGNLTTLTMYAGLNVATFFLILFIQQVGGYKPVEAGLSLLPITVIVFLLSRRFAAFQVYRVASLRPMLPSGVPP